MVNKIAIVLGTRPEIIKLSPLIRLLQKRGRPYFIVHTGQHYSYEMDRLFFKELGLRAPKYRLPRPKTVSTAVHTAQMTRAIEEILRKERPRHALVQGDTNSVLAGALAAGRVGGILLGHVEAGLRSYDRRMPEEQNRIRADHASDLLFAPTAGAKKILLGEFIPAKRIFVTGNTVVDAVLENLAIAKRRSGGAAREEFFLMTLHRQENVDSKTNLSSILKGLSLVTREFKRPVLFPVHPRTRLRLREFGLRLPPGVHAMKPVGFLTFLSLEASSRLILTDSGGLQEEACILKVPCVTLRTSTERPETVEVGANEIAGYSPGRILTAARRRLAAPRRWKNPFGDGCASRRILRIVDRA